MQLIFKKYQYMVFWVYSGYAIAFAVKGEYSFCNGFTRNVVIFDVDNSVS